MGKTIDRRLIEFHDLSDMKVLPAVTLSKVEDENPDAGVRIEIEQNWGSKTHSVWIPINRVEAFIAQLKALKKGNV